ncbi:hypothetical protein C7H19_18995 [Aphanothece hegewaldii CCALA 016]|uniref:Uncharacterized protein n=1 Tax=Aphanothece hegewaldii CCALA 016 TaxID=2107694 RepID=A0A2T1LTS6_9CHRO|nr:hypothetical protein [Aphanothece hegewaldii]PSF34515.1 hypothetical protein C7H19_18995 [Aphanothece hegewaldii CCALA 016]
MGDNNKTKLKLDSKVTKLDLVTPEAATNTVFSPWTIKDSENLYRIPGWGKPDFSINAAGHITVSTQCDLAVQVPLASQLFKAIMGILFICVVQEKIECLKID